LGGALCSPVGFDATSYYRRMARYDFAAELWGPSTRGDGFVEHPARLRAELLGDEPAAEA
jgi:hypothetical protein